MSNRSGREKPQADHGDGLRTVAVASGKGGVGKTSVVVNLAVALARRGEAVTLLDADYGLGNVDILLGLEAECTLEQVLRGNRPLRSAVLQGPDGLVVIPAASGAQDLTRLTPEQQGRLGEALAEIGAAGTRWLLVDTATGISDNVVSWLDAADLVLVIASPEPAAIVDAYAVLKILARNRPGEPLALVVNQAADEDEAMAVHEGLEAAVREFLGAELACIGWVAHDPLLGDAARSRRPLVTLAPEAPASRCFERLAERLLRTTIRRCQGEEASRCLAPIAN